MSSANGLGIDMKRIVTPVSEDALNRPFVSESYDRLLAAQARHKADSAILDAKPAIDAIRVLHNPVTDMKAARATLGLTQTALADALDMDAPRLSKMENGGVIDRRTDLAVRCLLAMEAK